MISADFTVSSRTGDNFCTVIFTDFSTGTIDTREWILGDGTVVEGNELSVTHTYTTPGKYTVTLVARSTTEQDAEVKTDYIVVNEVRATPSLIIMQAFDNVAGYWRFYFDIDFHLVFETEQYIWRSADKITDPKAWTMVQFNYASEKMYIGSYHTSYMEIVYSKTVNTSPVSMTEAKTEIAYQSYMKLDELKVWSTEKDLADYFRGTRGQAAYLDLK